MRIRNMLTGLVDGVIVSNGTPYLKIDTMAYHGGASNGYLVPLLCPICGAAWHFVGEQDELERTLSAALDGFEVVRIRYISPVTPEALSLAMNNLYFDSSLQPFFVGNVAEHAASPPSFSAISIEMECRLPIDYDKMRAEPEEQLRRDFELAPDESISDFILEMEEINPYDVDDDMTLIVHPESLLCAIVVPPTLYDYGAALFENE